MLDLIGEVYDAANDPELWRGLAPKIARAFDSPSTAVVIQPGPREKARWLSRTANIDDRAAEEYEAYYYQRDVWAKRAAQMEMSRIFVSEELISEADFLRTEYHQDWIRKVDVFYVVGTVFPVAESEIGVLGIHRPRPSGSYGEEDKRNVALFLPHLQRALQLRQRLAKAGMERQVALDALERSGTATLLVTGEGRVLYASGRAEALLREGDAIRVIAGRLATAARSATERLTALLHGAIDAAAGRGGTSGGALSVPRSDRLPISMLVAPFRPARGGVGGAVPMAIVFVRDPERITASSMALQGLFCLTPSEAAVASALTEGKSTEDIAANHGISLNTLRTHLKNIFGKTGTSRQGELVALLLRSVAVLNQK